eukprot:6213074-Pleurochrysis_carterae.AAC.1
MLSQAPTYAQAHKPVQATTHTRARTQTIADARHSLPNTVVMDTASHQPSSSVDAGSTDIDEAHVATNAVEAAPRRCPECTMPLRGGALFSGNTAAPTLSPLVPRRPQSRPIDQCAESKTVR